MKKIATSLFVLLSSVAANAQTGFQGFYDREFNFDLLHIAGTLIGIFLFTSFFLAIFRLFLDGRIKKRMIEKGVSENIVEQFLQPTKTDNKGVAIKWFLIMACTGIGLFIINATLPLGIHSVAIMALSISAGFLGYYLFIRKSEKK
ncbi:MAG: hypothetical protein JST47_10455 [Bacteroidetes bacterium]|nr:hypothetical protein [Bacteroidota bacterium]MBS1974758.1 hypothetical protein [Bacteroidota bacterium]